VLRTAVLLFGCLVLLVGAFLCIRGVGYGGIQILIVGAIFVLGTLCERWRYNNKNVASNSDWQVTGERFVDPATGKVMEVLYDPGSGERRYQEARNP